MAYKRWLRQQEEAEKEKRNKKERETERMAMAGFIMGLISILLSIARLVMEHF